MRPLNLKFQAFGAFLDLVEIPFERLGNENIYLISGVTGSGKTTIFDAICYALFNSSSGSNRGNTTLRSHFASDKIESFVELTFLFNNEKYKIIRKPSYERKKSRGEGNILEPAKAQLFLPNGKIIEKVKEVDEYIVELLGLNVSQFSQIALLAQGEFLKLLNADTSTRAEIFRNIFKTWKYADFQNKLKDKTQTYKIEYENIKNSILQYISDVFSNSDELSSLKERYLLNNCFDNLDELLEKLNIQNQNDKNEIDKIKKELLSIEEINNNLQKDFVKIKAKINLQNQKDEANSSLLKLDYKYIILEKKYNKSIKKQQTLEKISNLIEKTKQDCKKSSQIKEIKSDLVKYQTELNSKDKLNLELQDKLNDLRVEYLKYSYFEHLKSNEKLKTFQNEFLNFQKNLEIKTLDYTKKYNTYLRQQAGIIALSLKENEPCPVCGSIVHPNIAKVENQELTKEFLDKLKISLDEDNLKLANYVGEISKLKEKVSNIEKTYKTLEKKFNLKAPKNSETINELNFEDEISTLEEKIKSNNEKTKEISEKILENNTKLNVLAQEIDIENIENIILKHTKLIQRYNYLDEKIKSIKESYLNIKLEKANLITKIELFEKQLKQYFDVDSENIEYITSKIEIQKEKLIELNDAFHKILIRKTNNEKLYQTIQAKNKEYIKISNLYQDYKYLSDCANGNLKGSIRMPFEQYIQGYYLDLVLIEANKRLKIMSQNQFQLLRKKDVTSMQSKTGLDLEVMDFHTFKKRSTKTLSGGESFKAALSLALGLSDCVSNISRAMNIDSLFIDEGFGSLDSESLELAADVIFNLSSANRLIGVISHIEDLKSKVQNQILAIKTQNGSKLEINF